MKFSSTASITRQVILAGTLAFLLLAGCCLLIIGLNHSGWIFTAGCCLIEIGYAGARWVTGKKSHIEWLLMSAKGFITRWREKREESKARRYQAREWAAARDAHLERQINELAELHVATRLAELERAEELRSRQEWSEMRDVWRVLVLDPNTSEEIRASCREWLAKYPETLDYLARRLTQTRLVAEKDLGLDEQWEEQAPYKWRVQ